MLEQSALFRPLPERIMINPDALNRLTESVRSALGPTICAALDDPTVVEIMVNPDGRVYIERMGSSTVYAGTMAAENSELVIGAVAHLLSSVVTTARPIISGKLPIGGHRFEGLIPPAVARAAFTIRKRAPFAISLAQYVEQAIMTDRQAEILRGAIRARQNIVVAGGTGSGKTTLCNALLGELVALAPHDRLVILEDTPEIQSAAENHVCLNTTDTVDMSQLLKTTLRLRPDRIIVGEVRDGAALTLLKAWNTGHPGGVTTLHANSARTALIRLEQLVAEVSVQTMRSVIGEAVDLVIAIERAPEGRRVSEIIEVKGAANGQFDTRTLSHTPSPQSRRSDHAA